MLHTTRKNITVQLGDAETLLPVEIDYRYIEGCRGRRDAYGCAVEPDEPATAEIVAVRCRDVPNVLELLPGHFWTEVEGELAEEHGS